MTRGFLLIVILCSTPGDLLYVPYLELNFELNIKIIIIFLYIYVLIWINSC
jgi:hypothetical protein